MSQTVTELYTLLKPVAFNVISGVVKGVDSNVWRENAHDITTDFLIFSRSYRVTFDRNKGEILPFFKSYVRRKCRRLHDIQNKARLMGNIDVLDISSEQTFEELYELTEEMKSQVLYLRRFRYFDCDGVSVPLQAIYLANLRCNLELGRTDREFIAKRLGFPFRKKSDLYRVTSMMRELRRVLRERHEYATQDFSRMVKAAS